LGAKVRQNIGTCILNDEKARVKSAEKDIFTKRATL